MAKLLVIVGITGNQGSSVAEAFLNHPSWKVRGISRDPSKPESQALIKKGIEIVGANLDDVESLKTAFQGASAIFGNTAFSNAFAMPTDADYAKLKPNQTLRQWCYQLELRQGKNIADAVAAIDTLDIFVWSTLSNASKWSKGQYRGVLHFDSKAHVVDYMHSKYPELSKKLSLLQLGLFVTNWKWGQAAVPWEKRPDGSFALRVPGSGNFPIPLLVPADAGKFARALLLTPPGKNLMAYGSLISWSEYVKTWSETTGIPAVFEQSTVSELDKLAPGGYGEEIGEMYAYSQDFGYWGNDDPSVIYPKDIELDIPATTAKEYIQNEDWSELLNRQVPS